MVANKTDNAISNDSMSTDRTDSLKSALVNTLGVLMPTKPSPEDSLGELFSAVQTQGLFEDPQTFIDLIPRRKPKRIKAEYDLKKDDPNFNLEEFTRHNFFSHPHNTGDYQTKDDHTPREHIHELWTVLKRKYLQDSGSLIALPYEYVVPGGRFASQFYWDSYFIMIGLLADGQLELAEGMLKNAAFMLRKFGLIPNGNRTYFLSRSHPPFFSHMVRLVAGYNNRTLTMVENLPYLLAEYRFWTKTDKSFSDDSDEVASRRVVRMPEGSLLARYYDNKMTPRPEQLYRDITTAKASQKSLHEKLYLDMRAGAESGWDFSSRWFSDPEDLGSIHTTDIIPIDLNCLLYHLELTIAETYHLMRQPILERKFLRLANRRKAAVRKYLWDDKEKFFIDYDFREGKRTGRLTLAAVFPLFVKLATPAQAKAVAQRLEKDFLKKGGLVTTLIETGEQWDAPNGWAPLQWVAIQGLRQYGYHELADKIKKAWVKTCINVYQAQGKMVEKYNVVHPTELGGGGEYALQDGFGWTNGVLAALLAEDDSSKTLKSVHF